MKYIMPIQVRYSELGKSGVVELYQLLEYLQDCCIFQSESLGYKVKEELEINRGWFLLSWNVEIDRYPHMGEKLQIVTEPYKMRGFYGYRRFWILDENDMTILRADSLWMLMNLQKMLPQRVPKDMIEAYISDVSDDKVTLKRKLPEDGEWAYRDEIHVNRHFLDSNSHVNNAYYVMWAEECLPKNFQTKLVKVDYRQSSFNGDVISIDVIETKDLLRCRFRNQNNVLLALVEFHGDGSL